jgi:hypothetical protein
MCTVRVVCCFFVFVVCSVCCYGFSPPLFFIFYYFLFNRYTPVLLSPFRRCLSQQPLSVFLQTAHTTLVSTCYYITTTTTTATTRSAYVNEMYCCCRHQRAYTKQVAEVVVKTTRREESHSLSSMFSPLQIVWCMHHADGFCSAQWFDCSNLSLSCCAYACSFFPFKLI